MLEKEREVVKRGKPGLPFLLFFLTLYKLVEQKQLRYGSTSWEVRVQQKL